MLDMVEIMTADQGYHCTLVYEYHIPARGESYKAWNKLTDNEIGLFILACNAKKYARLSETAGTLVSIFQHLQNVGHLFSTVNGIVFHYVQLILDRSVNFEHSMACIRRV